MKIQRPLRRRPGETALAVVIRGVAAGFAGTLLLSLFSRLVPWLHSTRRTPGRPTRAPSPQAHYPRNPFSELDPNAAPGAEAVSAMTPAEALALASGPSPEGAAERFALKLGSGLFGRDLAPLVRPAGLAVHVLYGSFWGVVYGILQSSLRWSPTLAGLLHGLAVWTIGPGWLVPAMKLMRHPDEQPAATNVTLAAGHLLYGFAVSSLFELLRSHEPDA